MTNKTFKKLYSKPSVTAPPSRDVDTLIHQSSVIDASKIASAIERAGSATKEFSKKTAQCLTEDVLLEADRIFKNEKVTMRAIHRLVKKVLMNSPFQHAAHFYKLDMDQQSGLKERMELNEEFPKKLIRTPN